MLSLSLEPVSLVDNRSAVGATGAIVSIVMVSKADSALTYAGLVFGGSRDHVVPLPIIQPA